MQVKKAPKCLATFYLAGSALCSDILWANCETKTLCIFSWAYNVPSLKCNSFRTSTTQVNIYKKLAYITLAC